MTNKDDPVSNLKALQNIIKRLADLGVNDAAEGIITQASTHIVEREKTNTGELLRSAFNDDSEILVRTVGFDAPHALTVEFGRSPGARQPPVDAIEEWVNLKLGVSGKEGRNLAWGIAKSISKHGIEPTNFFRDAIDKIEVIDYVTKRIKDGLQKKINL